MQLTLNTLKLVQQTLNGIRNTRIPGAPVDGCRDTYAVASKVDAEVRRLEQSPAPQESDLVAMVRELCDTLEEAHDTHIFAEDDEHDDDCGYCAIVARGRALIGEKAESDTDGGAA